MVLCFLVGGFSAILYSIQAYSAFMSLEVFGSFREFKDPNTNFSFNESLDRLNANDFNRSMLDRNREFGGRFRPLNPVGFITSPASLVLLLVAIVSILGGISIYNLVREKEIKSTKDDLTSILLSPEEKAVISEIKKMSGDITQSQLVKKTGLSKVKIHRVLIRLESKRIVKKYQYGLTNKIVLEKDIF